MQDCISQAFVSPNWYQGGNNYLALLINFLWDVTKPGLSSEPHVPEHVSYKLGLNSN